jgi:Zn-dependent protease with chaperone function
MAASRSARRRQILLVAGAAAAIVAGQWLVALPPGAHSEAVLRGFGISTQSWAGWLRDRTVGLLVSLAVTVLAMLLLWWLTRRAPRRWPWLLAGIAAAVTVAASTLYPLVVESLYTHVTSLPAGPLRTSIEQLAARDGLGDVRVVVSNASSRTTGENAHVSGLGATRRIALDDTLVARSRTDPAAVLVVVAHELGHVRNQDVARGTTIAALAVPTGVLLLSWVLTSAGARRLFRPQSTAPRQVARSVALVLAITTTAPLLAAPVTNLVSRRIEAAADLHALQRTGDVAAFERIQRDLATSNLIRLRSAWWQTLLFETHPAPAWRIAMAQAWSRGGGSAGG